LVTHTRYYEELFGEGGIRNLDKGAGMEQRKGDMSVVQFRKNEGKLEMFIRRKNVDYKI